MYCRELSLTISVNVCVMLSIDIGDGQKDIVPIPARKVQNGHSWPQGSDGCLRIRGEPEWKGTGEN